MRTKILITAIAFFCGTITIAQTELNNHPHIDVNGKAELLIDPDQIYLSITFKDREKGRDINTVENQIEILKKELKRINISLSNLTLANSDADYIHVKYRTSAVQKVATFQLILKNAQEVSNTFKMLDSIDVENAFISKVTHSKIEELNKEVRINAIKAAKEKATYLLTAIDAKIGSPLQVNEVDQNNNYYRSSNFSLKNNAIQNYSQNIESLEGNQIGFKKIRLTAEVFVKFSIL